MNKREYSSNFVMPAKAGIQNEPEKSLDASFRWHDIVPQTLSNKLVRCVLFTMFTLLTACGEHVQNFEYVDTTNLSQLESIRVYARSSPTGSRTELSQLRSKSLQDSAMSIGAQAGLAWASGHIDTEMQKDRKYLDTIYNFNAMMLSHGVLPPVLERGDNTINLDDPNTIRVSDRTYKIVKQAQFVSTAPNWREYLSMVYSKPILPDRTLLPRTALEQEIWRKGIRLGWDMGIEQAHTIFQQNLARLKRDYNGMVIYRKLLENKMISPPFVARTELGVTGDGDNMRVNVQVLRIV